MRTKITILNLLSLLLLSHGVFAQTTYTVKGKNNGAKDQTKVFLEKNTISNVDGTDSTFIINEHFLFQGRPDSPIECILRVESANGENKEIIFWLENSTINITGASEDFRNAIISGSKSQLDYEKYVTEVGNEKSKFNAQYYDSISAILTKKFIQNNRGSYKSIQELYLFRQIFRFPEVKELYSILFPGIRESKYGKLLKIFLESYLNLEIGDVAPTFNLPDIEGNNRTLGSYHGKYVLLIFWGSWCPPCRTYNIEYNKIFNARDSGKLVLVGIALDNDSDLSIAIKKDKIKWDNLITRNGFDNPLLYKYGVYSVPANFLIDPRGKIKAIELTPYSQSNVRGSLNNLLIDLGLISDNSETRQLADEAVE